MATLPDMNSLGGLPSGSSGRVSVDYSGVVAPGRGYAQGFERLGEGYRELGRGIANLGGSIQNFGERIDRKMAAEAEREQASQNRLASSQASAEFLTAKLNLDNEVGQATDYTQVGGYGQKYLDALETSAQYIQDPEHRALFIQRHMDDIARSNDRIADTSQRLYKQNYLAGLNETMTGLQKAGLTSQDPTEQARVLAQGREFLQDAAAHGVITSDVAQRDIQKWEQGFAYSAINSLPPEQRLERLGVSRPGQIAAKDMQPHEVAFLNALAGPESAGRYNVRYTPGGGATFNNFADHPRIYEPGPDGPSSAAGRYQFVASTWDKVIPSQFKQGGFSPENQDHAAMWYARQVYRQKTGGDLDQELLANGVSDKVVTALGNTWRGLRDNPAKSRSWYKATIQNAPDVQGSYQIASSSGSMAGILSPENYDKSVHNAFRDLEHQNNVSATERRQTEASVKQLIQDDWASVTATGKPIDDLTPDRVEQVFGHERRLQFEAEREIGKDYWTATHDFDALPTTDIRARLDSLRPTGDGESMGFKVRAKMYADAEKRAMAVIKERNEDPAAAADRLPNVAAVKRDVDLGGDANAQRALVRERMKAFEVIGIPAERQVPVTRQEARDMMAPVLDALPGQEKAALQMVVPKIKEVYGEEMTGRILGYALRQAKADAETQEVAARVLKKIGLGQTVKPSEVQQLDTAKTNDALGKVGKVPPAEPTPVQKNYPMPPDAAIQALVGQPTPDRIQQFDLTFGPGAAKRILGAAASQSSKGGDK